MAFKTSRTDPFDIRLTEAQQRDLSQRLVDEIRTAKQARTTVIADGGLIDFAYSIYEQQSQKGISRDTVRYGGADLTSPIGTENVDGLAARMAKTTFVEPVWIVEGVGKSAKNAPVVEEYMQWRQESMRLQKTAKKVGVAALVETGSIFEVCEDTEPFIRRETVKAAIAKAEDGTAILDAKTGKPMPAREEDGTPIPCEQEDEGYVEVHREWQDYRRRGAYVRRRSMKDFLFLPSHAEDEREVWGHATRFWLPLSEIKRREKNGEYTNVPLLGGDTQERQQGPEQDRSGTSVEHTPGYDNAEKELWKLQLWADLDGKGLTMYVAVVSEIHACILSLKYDWLARFRTIYANPYPCSYSVYGYSLILTKLLTTIEEHTAWRNMNADRGTLKSNAPMKRLHGAQWDPTIQPFGAGEVIDVGAMDEVMPFDFDDITAQAMQKEQQCVTDAQRIIGMNDVAIGQLSAERRTLGENEMASQQSFVRTDDPIGNFQEALEELAEVIHAIEVQTLKEMEHGREAPAAVTEAISTRTGQDFEGTFTYQMIDGHFRFKPRGSTDGADPNRRRASMVNGLGLLANWAKLIPGVMQRLQQPEMADALMQWWADEFKPRDRGPFVKALPPPAPPEMPGMPPGAPPQGALPPGAVPPGAMSPPGAVPPPAAGPGGAPNFGGAQLVQALAAQLPPGGHQ